MAEGVVAVIAAIGAEIGGTVGASLIIYAEAIATIVVAAATVSYAASEQARAKRASKDSYNDSLRDRTLTVRSTIQASRVVLGRVRVGGALTFIGTTGQYKERLTMIVALAGHEIDAVEQIYFDDTPITLDAVGSVQTAPWRFEARGDGSATLEFSGGGGGGVTLAQIPLAGSVFVSSVPAGPEDVPVVYAASVVGKVVSVSGLDPAFTGSAYVTYAYAAGGSSAVISAYLGRPDQVVNPTLAALLPAQWDASHRGREVAYLLCDFAYDPDAYPSGLPNVSAVVRGAKVLDPRSGLTAWSESPPLLMRYYALSPLGGRLAAGSVRDADVIAAANICDATATYTVGGVATTGPLYTAGTMAQSDARPLDVLSDLARSMAGSVAFIGNQLRMKAGSYVVPLVSLGEDDFSGGAMQVQPRVPRDQLFNIVTGTFVDPANGWQVVDMPRVESAAYITEDGTPLPLDVQFSSVTRVGQTQQLAAVMLRQSRQALTVVAGFKLSAYAVELFDTIRLSCSRYGWVNKTFEVLDRQWSLEGLIVLTLRETGPSIYTLGTAFDAVDAEPNTLLPSPFVVPAVTALACASGTAQLMRQADGTVVSRILVTWNTITDEQVLSGGGVEVRYGQAGQPEPLWQSLIAPAGQTRIYIDAVQDRRFYFAKARAFNALVRGQWSPVVGHLVVGKTAPPSDVTGLVANVARSGVEFRKNENFEADSGGMELRVGATWAASTPLFRGDSDTWTWVSPPVGSYTVLAKHYDTTGNESLNAASVGVVVTASDAVQWTSIIGRPKLFRIVSRGFSDITTPIQGGLYDGDTGTLLAGVSASYLLSRIRRSDGAVVFSQFYNLLSDAAAPANLAAALNASGPDVIVVVRTFDEPRSNRLTGGLEAAMYRCGASRAVFGSPEFKFRSAYVMVGIGACGEGNGFESYSGQIDSDTTAWCDVAFSVQAGNLIITGSGATPRSLADYSYTGSLDATTDLVLVARGVVLNGNTASKIAGAVGWNADVYSRDSFTGGAYASVVAARADQTLMFGLNSDPTTDASYTSIDFSIYLIANGLFEVYESGVSAAVAYGSYSAGDVFAVIYEGSKVQYLRNGSVFRTISAGAGLALFFDSSFNSVGSSLRNIRFGPMSSVTGIGTEQLLPEAATAVYQDNFDFAGLVVPNGINVQRTFTVTPAVACTIQFTATLAARNIYGDAAAQASWAVSAGGGADVLLGVVGPPTSSGYLDGQWPCSASFTAAAGVPLVFKIYGRKAAGITGPALYLSSMTIIEIRR